MKIKLNSDFIDYYDHWFCRSTESPDFVFNRYSRSGLSRKPMFDELCNLGFNTPRYGEVKNLVNYTNNRFIIVYLDEYSHQGEDKIKCSPKFAHLNYPDYLGSEFLEEGNGFSYRLLKVGNLCFKLSYSSKYSWKSNCGDVRIKLFNYIKLNEFINTKQYPLLAIDFVLHNGGMYAFDLNTAPLLKCTGIENWFSSKEIYKEIENFYGKIY